MMNKLQQNIERNSYLYGVSFLLLFIFARLFFLDSASLWYDELHTAVATGPNVSWQDFWQKWLIRDVHPPLFYLIIYAWQQLGFNSDFALRLWPFIFSIAFLPFVWFLQRHLIPTRQFIIYVLLLSLAPHAVYYGAELRSYALLYCLSVIALVFFHRLIAALQVPAESNILNGIGLAVCCGLLALTHYFSFYLISAFYLMLFFRVEKTVRPILSLLLPAMLASIPALIWFAAHRESLADRAGGNFWISNNIAGFVLFFITFWHRSILWTDKYRFKYGICDGYI